MTTATTVGAGAKTLKPVKKARRGAEIKGDDALKFLFYGESGVGKTYVIVMLLIMGWKVLYLSTELGGDGLLTVTDVLTRMGREDLLVNLTAAPHFDTYNEVAAFLKDPAKTIPDIYEWDTPGSELAVFWDGFTEFQLLYLERYIADDLQPERPREEREAGLFLVEKDWNMVMNGTLRGAHDFFGMYNVRTGKRWHKFVTCKAAEKEREGSGIDGKPVQFKAKNTFILQGAAKKVFEGAFDFIFRVRIKTKLVEGKPRAEYIWACLPRDNQTAKVRGEAVTEAEIPADFAAFWSRLRPGAGAKS